MFDAKFVTVTGLVELVKVAGEVAGFGVTVYEVIGSFPLSVGTVNATDA